MLDTIDSLIVSVVSAMDEEVEDLVGWELSTMDYASLQDFFYEEKRMFYLEHPDAFEDMKIYMQECIDPSVVFYHDVEKKGNE